MDNDAHRLTYPMPGLYLACGIALAALAVAGVLPEPGWRIVMAGIGIASVVTIGRNDVPRPFVLLAVAPVYLAVLELPEHAGEPSPADDAVLATLLGLVLCSLMLIAVHRRYGRVTRTDLIDLVTVAVGVGLFAWIVVAEPMSGSGGLPIAIASTSYLPLATLLLLFSIDVTCSGLHRNVTSWLVMAATAANLAGSWLLGLRQIGTLGDASDSVIIGILCLATALVVAALSHPHAAATLEVTERDELGSEGTPRLAVVGASVMLPIGAAAVVPSSSTIDLTARIVGVTLLVAAVVTRLTVVTFQHRVARAKLLHQLTCDDLTKLPTRTAFVDRLDSVLEETWHSERRPTVVRLNLDRFKNVNDSFGHYVANEVLIVLAERLDTFAASFGGFAGRIGGDEFAIVDPNTPDAEAATARAEDVRAVLTPVIDVGESGVFLTASIGAAIAPRHRTVNAEDLLRQSDIATHRAKTDGRNRVALFDDSMQASATRRMDVEHALHGAIGRQEMRLYHQPIVDITTGRIAGFEALMRWQRQDGTLVQPGDFVHIAEETGIICELGAWALHDALRELQRWIDDGVVPASTTMSVNASPRQIADPAFPHIVREALAAARVSPDLLWVEITESMMLDDPEVVQRTLEELGNMGVRIALDDFGTGYSSLSILQQFPIHRIKIDRAFVQGIADRPHDRSLVRTVIAMARSMALDLVAEGVETIDQLEALRDLGCDKAQGYLISRPVPSDAMRSTMVAIDELALLPLFEHRTGGAAGEHGDRDPAATASSGARNASPADSASTPTNRQYAGTGPMLQVRPLGGPRI